MLVRVSPAVSFEPQWHPGYVAWNQGGSVNAVHGNASGTDLSFRGSGFLQMLVSRIGKRELSSSTMVATAYWEFKRIGP